jgi:4-amino-4-deoxy-L-arabinose transferase-like glycosyltransferase
MPFFPMMLAGIYSVVGAEPTRAQFVIVLLSVVNVGLAYLAGKQLGGVRGGLIAASFVAIDIDQINFSTVIMTETVTTTLVTLSGLTMIWLQRTGRFYWAVFAGMVMSLALLTRVNVLVFIPFVCGWLLWRSPAPLQKRLTWVGVIGAICGVAWGGWIVRNYMVFGEFVPLTTQGGNGYYGVFNDIAAAPQPLETFGYWRNMDLPPEIIAIDNEVEWDRAQRELAFEWMQAHPTQTLQLALVQVYHFWRSDSGSPFFLLALFLGVIGIYRLAHMQEQGWELWLIISGSLTLMSIIALAVPRFNIPLFPAIAALAGVGAQYVVDRFQLGQKRVQARSA